MSRRDAEPAGLVRTILDGRTPGALKSACDTLYARLSELAGLRDESRQPDEVGPCRLPAGTAIAPLDAARCIQDIARTSLFMRGVRAAVWDARQRFPDRTIEVLYAGCGPFAPLTLPLILEFDPGEVQITLVDAHARALSAARTVYDRLDALGHVRRWVHADASQTVVDARRPPHVVVVECMQRALTKEPQVTMTRHLAGQLLSGGILIPERITIDACLADISKEFALDPAHPTLRDRILLGTLLELSAETREPFTPVVVEIPEAEPRFALQLLTTVQVYGDLVLRDYDSGITFPLVISGLAGARAAEFSYREGETPGWQCRAV